MHSPWHSALYLGTHLTDPLPSPPQYNHAASLQHPGLPRLRHGLPQLVHAAAAGGPLPPAGLSVRSPEPSDSHPGADPATAHIGRQRSEPSPLGAARHTGTGGMTGRGVVWGVGVDCGVWKCGWNVDEIGGGCRRGRGGWLVSDAWIISGMRV